VLWINHDIAQVNEIADALTYIDRKVLLDGAPHEVLATGVAKHLFPTLALPVREAAS
jgi:ABC-type Mn2+/Zn2+ transport system ATPase subunit